MLKTEEILAALERKLFSKLIGLFESHCLEFKSEPYRLYDDRQKFELAKDVAALANSGGGIILIGIATERRNDSSADCASEIRPIQRSICNLDQMRQCVNNRTFPALDLEVCFYEVTEGSDSGLVLCHVPSQDEGILPVLVRKPYDNEEEGRALGAYIGIFERARSHTSSFSVEKIHALLKAGEGMVVEISGKLDAILRSTSSGSGAMTRNGTPKPEQTRSESGALIEDNEVAKSRSRRLTAGALETTATQDAVEILATAANLEGKRFFWLSATPERSLDLSRILESRTDPIVQLIEQPPVVREGGFDLRLDARSRIITGDRRRLVLQNYGALELTIHGRLLFVGHPELLCWGREARQTHAFLINQLSLTELVMLFSELASEIYLEAGFSGDVRLGFGVSRLRKTENVKLEAGPLKGFRLGRPETAADSTFEHFVNLDLKMPDASAAALICSVYNYFGIESDRAPYIKLSDGVRTIDRALVASDGP